MRIGLPDTLSIKMRDLAICATSHPIALAASSAIRVESGSSVTSQEKPLSIKKFCIFLAPPESSLFITIPP